MRTKFTLQALSLVSVLALSGLPAFAADMAPVTAAPGAAITTDSKANVVTPAPQAQIKSDSKAGLTTPAVPAPRAALPTDTKAGVSADTKVAPSVKKDGNVIQKGQKDSLNTKAPKHAVKTIKTAKVVAPVTKVQGAANTSITH